MPLPPPTSLGLPAKPGSAPHPPAPNTTNRAAPSSSTLASSSTSTPSPNCSICKAPAKYTCPRCAARSCSLPCSKAHKEKKGCSGVRDPAAFVPLAKFTQGTWDGDYAWLEAARRQVAAFGEGVSAEEVRGAVPGRGRGRGRGRGGTQAVGRQRKPKSDGLRWALAQIGAEVDVLPDGMQKRRQNQSSWNPKTQTLAITLQLIPAGRLAPTDKAPVPVHARVPVLPTAATLQSLVPEAHRSTAVVFAMPYHIPRRRSAELRPPGRGAYFPLLPGNKGLDVALHGTAFVEFPVVHMWAKDEWERAVRSHMVGVLPSLQPPRVDEEEVEEGEEVKEQPAKRAKVDQVEVNALAGLGDYGDSEEEDEEDEGVEAAGDGGEGEDGEGGGDITLDPAMADALGKALAADFGTS